MTLSLSRQRPLQQALYIFVGEVDGAVHAGVAHRKPGRCEQFRLRWRHLVERSRRRE